MLASIARAYGLPKVHKDGCPLRMIVSLIYSPCHNLAKWLELFLRPLIANSAHSIDNPVQFSGTIKNVTVSSNECMVSFDVVSLFTSIPLDLARETIRDLFTGTPLSVTTDGLLDLLNHCLINYFQVYGEFYRQVKGMPMGSPISGLIAEAVLQRLEAIVFHTFTLKIWKRYVDDTFVIIDTGNFSDFHIALNNALPGIQFILDKEKDVPVCRM